MTEKYLVDLPDEWITATHLEQALQRAWSSTGKPLSKETMVTFSFPSSCKVMVDAAVRLLSLANQLAAMRVPISFTFVGEQNEAMSYLNRAFFFSLLSERVQVLPKRPDSAYAERYQGRSSRLVEFKPLHPRYDGAVETVPAQLADALETVMATRSESQAFGQTPYTLFTELINNVYDHSETELDGFAALQVYQQHVLVVVSDSGVGLLKTLRSKLLSPQAHHMEETELLRKLFCNELAWHDSGNGQGLQGCAQRSLKHHGRVDIRLETSRVVFYPSPTGYEKMNAHYSQNLAPLRGTHICFSFPLDRPQ